MSKIFRKLLDIKNQLMWQIHISLNKNKTPVIISRDCLGGAIYHQYRMRFLSPTINLFFTMNDFNIFCNNLFDFLDGKMEEAKGENSYPIGILYPKSGNTQPIKVHFIHYDTFYEALNKWMQRVKRCIEHSDNVFVINNCSNTQDILSTDQTTIDQFNQIPFKKMIYVQYHMGFINECIVKPIKNYHNAFVLDKRKNTWKHIFNNYNLNRFFNKRKQKI